MPCNEGDRYREERDELTSWLKGALCALITELEVRGIAYDIIKNASDRGRVDIMTFWSSHSEEDKVRLAADLSKYSEHEKDILRKMLSE